jgi:two-component system phosphate regulon sensor histidine kinase PhoR
LVTAAVCLLTYLFAGKEFESYVTKDYVEHMGTYVNSLAPEYFTFDGKSSLKNTGDPDEFIQGLLRNRAISGAKITDANGLVIASTLPGEVNTALLDNQPWLSALGGSGSLEALNRTTGTVTLYLPIISGTNSIKGVVVLNASFPNDLLVVRRYTNTALSVVFGASLIFVIVAYLTMAELEEKMEAKERSIFDQSKAQTEEKQLYEAITASIAEALIVINKNRQIMMLNKEAEKMTGHKSGTVEFRSYEKVIIFYDEGGKIIKKDPIALGLEKGELVHISSREGFYLKTQSDILVPVAVNVAPVTEDQSFVKGVAVTIIDNSTERELQKVKDEFVYVVAHELGNPIFALDGYLSLLKSYSKTLKKEGRDILANTIEINKQLSSLVNDLLEVARNETGRLTFDLESIKVEDILAEVIKNNSFKAKEHSIKLSSRITELPKAVGNERKIKEVITNLIDNGIKYTPAKGTVHAEAYVHDGRVIISIADNGIGLSPEGQKHLFEKFFRAKSKASEGISGTGLGLFIAKQIVEKCGGKIWATSEEGKGSKFYIALKIAK